MLWQSIKQRNPACRVRAPVSDGSVWLWYQLSFPKEINSSLALGRHSFCVGIMGVLTCLFSLQALIAIPSCPGSSWLPATSPQPPDEKERWSWFPLLCSCSFYPFLSILVCWACSLFLLCPALGLLGWNQPSLLLLDRRAVFCSDPLHCSLAEPPFAWLLLCKL